jgi:deoxyribose-phosphate aldolase
MGSASDIMDQNEVIDRITREVLARIRDPDERKETGKIPRSFHGNNALVVILSGKLDADSLSREIESIAGNAKLTTIILSRWASKGISRNRLSHLLKTEVKDEVDLGGARGIISLIQGIDTIYIPDLDIASGSRIANFAPITPAEHLVSEAIIAGKRVISTCPLFSSQTSEDTPVCVRGIISDLEKRLASVGIGMTDSEKHIEKTPGAVELTEKCPQGHDECMGCGLCVNRNSQGVKNIINAGADRIGASLGVNVADPKIARLIDHTILKPDATGEEVGKLCLEAREYQFASVCVNPSYVHQAASILAGSPVRITTVIGFPLGATTPTAKVIETRDAIANGADEIDMVINIGALKSGNDELVRRDIQGVVDASKGKAIVKVILETALLTKEEKIRGCIISKMAGADFVKTSTGFGPGGATVEDIALMRSTVGPEMGIKASGGIRDFKTAKAMVDAGATRIGASASVAIVKGS